MGEGLSGTNDHGSGTLVASDHIDLAELAFSPTIGGIVLVGPTANPMRALAGLLASPEVEAVEADGSKLADWITSPHEVLQLTRQASAAIRSGRTAVIYLDSHRDEVARLPAKDYEFVCWRMGRVMLGLADQPAYVIVHGEPMAAGFFDAVGEDAPCLVGEIAPGLTVSQLTTNTMFPELFVTSTPGDETAAGLVQSLDFFEARRL